LARGTKRLEQKTKLALAHGMIMSAVGYLFALQSHPHLSAISFARQIATHPWLI
jgi:hypothetical protein